MDITENTQAELVLTIRNPDSNSSNGFGWSLTTSENSIFIGAPFDDDLFATNSGSVYSFNATTGELQFTISNPVPSDTDRFGLSLITTETQNILVGAPGTNSAYLFNPVDGQLLLTLNHPNSTRNSRFGWSLATLKNNIIVGSPFDDTGATNSGSVHIFDGETGELLLTLNNPFPQEESQFGASVATLGNKIIVGSPFDDTDANNSGSVHIFDSETGELLLTLANPTPEAQDNFGFTLAVVGDNFIVGARDDNTGAFSTGSAYLYDGNTGELLLDLNNPDPDIRDSFSRTIAVVDDKIFIGSRKESNLRGAIYVFDSITGNFITTIDNPEANENDLFSHAIFALENHIIASSIGDDTVGTDSGSVYVFSNPFVSNNDADLENTPTDTIQNSGDDAENPIEDNSDTYTDRNPDPKDDENSKTILTYDTDNGLFNLAGGDESIAIEFHLDGYQGRVVSEIGLFIVDDTQGRIGEILPNDPGYLEAALSRGKVIFSALAANIFPHLHNNNSINLNSDDLVGFYLIEGSSTDQVLADIKTGNTPNSVQFSLNSSANNSQENLQVTQLSEGNFSLTWQDFVLSANLDTSGNTSLGVGLQGDRQRELIDLRDFTSQFITAEFTVDSKAQYNNRGGLYLVTDESGTVVDADTGNLITPGESGYTEAALRSSVAEFSEPGTFQEMLLGGFFYAPYLIANGEEVYFPFLDANSDNLDHLQLLGNHSFAFEDLQGGGDFSYDDFVLQVNLDLFSG